MCNQKIITKVTSNEVTTNTVDINKFILNGTFATSITWDENSDDIRALVTARALHTNVRLLSQAIADIDPLNNLYQDNSVITLPIANTEFSEACWETSNWEVVYGDYAKYTAPINKAEAHNYIKLVNTPFTRRGTHFVSIVVEALDSGRLAAYDEGDNLLAETIVPGIFNFTFHVETPVATKIRFVAENVKENEIIILNSIGVYYVTSRLEQYLDYIVPFISSEGKGYATIEYVNRAIEDALAEINDIITTIPNINDINDLIAHTKDRDTNPHGINCNMIGAAPANHTHTPESIGAAPLDHTHTPEECGAAPLDHTHDLVELGAAEIDHTHTPESIGAATEDHTHTPDECGAAPLDHTHTPESIGAASIDHTHDEYITSIEADEKINTAIEKALENLPDTPDTTGVSSYHNNFSKLSSKFTSYCPIDITNVQNIPLSDIESYSTKELSLDLDSTKNGILPYTSNFIGIGFIYATNTVHFKSDLDADIDDRPFVSPANILFSNLAFEPVYINYTTDGFNLDISFFNSKRISGIEVSYLDEYANSPYPSRLEVSLNKSNVTQIDVQFTDNNSFIYTFADILNADTCSIKISELSDSAIDVFVPLQLKLIFDEQTNDNIYNVKNSIYSYSDDTGNTAIRNISGEFDITSYKENYLNGFHSVWFASTPSEQNDVLSIETIPVEAGYERNGIAISELVSMKNPFVDITVQNNAVELTELTNKFYYNKNILYPNMLTYLLKYNVNLSNKLDELKAAIDDYNVKVPNSNTITIIHDNLQHIAITGCYLLIDNNQYTSNNNLQFKVVAYRETTDYDGYESDSPTVPAKDKFGYTILDGTITPGTKLLSYKFEYCNTNVLIPATSKYGFINNSTNISTEVIDNITKIEYILTDNTNTVSTVSFLDMGVYVTGDFYDISQNTIVDIHKNKIQKSYIGGYTHLAGAFTTGLDREMVHYFTSIPNDVGSDDYVLRQIINPYYSRHIEIEFIRNSYISECYVLNVSPVMITLMLPKDIPGIRIRRCW